MQEQRTLAALLNLCYSESDRASMTGTADFCLEINVLHS